MSQRTLKGLARYVWAVLAYTMGVILWGAYVRISGSGAGCGRHWPLCNGEVIPRPERLETIIELTHRLTSGVAGVLVLGMLVWAFRAAPRGHPVRLSAAVSTALIVVEGLLGAGLVRFELVAENRSAFRAGAMALHLANTFLLLGAIALTGWWASGRPRVRLRWGGGAALLLCGLAATLLVGATGAVTALGDTVFPRMELGANPSTTRHFLERLRVVHPVMAVLTTILVIFAARRAARARPDRRTRRLASAVAILFVVQVATGALNIVLLVPAWMQLVHLLLADFAWLALVLLSASALAAPPPFQELSNVRNDAADRQDAPHPSIRRGEGSAISGGA